MNNQKGIALIAVILIVIALLAGGILTWQYLGGPKEERKEAEPEAQEEAIKENYCEKDTDCACGVNINTRDCFYGNKNYVDATQQCPDFCTGIAGNLTIKCIENKCEQVLKENETANWKIYRNEEYGCEIKYPNDWIFEVDSPGKKYGFLDIHLSNFQPSDSPACNVGFIGLEMQVGHTKDAELDFTSFVKSQLVESGLGPSGSIEEIYIDNHLGFKVQYSGWANCGGPGYFIEQDQNQYIYIFTGSHIDNRAAASEKLNQILSTFRFLE